MRMNSIDRAVAMSTISVNFDIYFFLHGDESED